MAELAGLKSQRSATKGCITRIKTIVETKSDTLSYAELECRLGILESYFKQILSYQGSIEGLLKDDDTLQAGELKIRGELEDLYCATKAKLLTLMAGHRKSSLAQESSMILPNVVMTNLPKLKLPHFSGRYSDFPNFIGVFNTLVHKEERLSSIEKFNHLLSCLSGPALRTIKAYEVTEENYPKALAQLKSRYDNKILIFQEHIIDLFNLPKVSKNSPYQLRQLIDVANTHISALLSVGTYEDITNAIIIHLVTSKLDSDSQNKWDEAMDLSKLSTWDECARVLNKRCQNLELRDSKLGQSESASPQQACKAKYRKSNSTLTSLAATNMACLFCLQNGHAIYKCPSFLELPVLSRFDEVKKRALCINCLTKGHSVKKCRAQKCRVCAMPHHTVLHRYACTTDISDQKDILPDHRIVDKLQTESSTSNTLLQSSFISNNNSRDQVILATAVVRVKDKYGQYHLARALLDSASQLNFMAENLAQLLNLKRSKIEMNISGIGKISSKVKWLTQTVVKSRINDFETNLSFHILPHITGLQPENQIAVENWKIPKNIELADPQFSKPQKIDILLGADTFFHLLCVGQIKLQGGLPTLQKTVLGWIVSGKCSEGCSSRSAAHCKAVGRQDSLEDKNMSLNELVERFGKEEEVDQTTRDYSNEMVHCENIFTNTLRRTPEGRFMVKLPFKCDPEHQLGNSFEIARRRFLALEQRLSKNMELKVKYSEFLHEYLLSGHMEAVTIKDIPSVHYFMPHQCVLRPESSSTKLRVVFDASCKTSTNKSLNDLLMVGATVQDDLFSIIFRFRFHKFALTADISAMYRQVLVYPEDRNFQLILWREKPSDELQIFRLKTVTYGTASAPFLAIRCLIELAKECKLTMPEVSKIIERDFYMDDLITGADSREEINTIKTQVEAILKSAQFTLKKWCSNDKKILEEIPKDDIEKTLKVNDTDVIKTLGIVWEPTTDQIRIRYNPNGKASSAITKRSILSDIARLFDPLGLVNPVIVKAKIFLQELWLINLNWDESIPQEIEYSWQQYKEELSYLNQISVPRLVVGVERVQNIEIHGFADASIRAYGCCVYIRVLYASGNISVNLLSAKSKVAPIRISRTLPCLELCAALLLSSLVDKIKGNFVKPYDNIYLWTDSEIVLDWLQYPPSTWKTYVANRVSEIQELTKDASWRHVTSKENPADIISRGINATELTSSIWFTGPTFLLERQEYWPPLKRRHLASQDLPEKRKAKSILVCSISESFLDCIYAISDYQKNCRRFAFILRFINNLEALKDKKQVISGMLTASEIDEAFIRIIWVLQQREFAEDIEALERGNELSPRSTLKKLTPFLENYKGIKLLRVGGRLKESDLPYDNKFPILLPRNNPFVKSYVRALHLKNFHAGPLSLISIIQRRFWIINARDYARKIVRNCIHCFRYRPRLAKQIMGDLPKGRINISLPFTHTGVDFCGPIQTTYKIRGKALYKSYIAIFVCFVTKAVHVEVVSDLSSDAFLAALKRFIGRRNLCRHLYCDNATNFVEARRQLQELRDAFFKQQVQHDIHTWCANNYIEFHHIPPRSPHFGGLWEAAVKSAKTHLYRTLKNSLLTFEELYTVMVQIEGLLNSRPITALSTDPNDEQVLTPAHFLNQAPLDSFVEPDFSSQKISYLRRWQRISALQQHFWKRWSREYLSQMQERAKWQSQHPNIKGGALVLIQQDDLPPYKWKLGRVVDTVKGPDGKVRVVQLKTATGSFQRSIHKVAPLPQDD